MKHKNRRYCLVEVDDLDQLAHMLVNRIQPLCSAFRWSGLLLANDSSSDIATQDYAVFRRGLQVESFLVSWMQTEKLATELRYLATASAESLKVTGTIRPELVESMTSHGTCSLCEQRK